MLKRVDSRKAKKGKVHSRTRPEGEYTYSSTLSLTSALGGGWMVKAIHRVERRRE